MSEKNSKEPIYLSFEDSSLLPALFGEHDGHLAIIEKALGVSLASRGDTVAISGTPKAAQHAREVLGCLYEKLERGDPVDSGDVNAVIRMMSNGSGNGEERKQRMTENNEVQIKTAKKTIKPHSNAQADYVRAMYQNDLCFGIGPAGTGKTYLAVAMAVERFLNRQVERIILSRPAVEAGEHLGFLPGDMKEKVDPYMRPLYDALHDMIPGERLIKHLELGDIEIAPLAFMRGRTLANAFVILDEAQNTTATQMKMFLTRIGEGSRMVVAGDLTQTDLPKNVKSGLRDCLEKLEGVDGIGCSRFSDQDVVRHPLAARIVRAYREADEKNEEKWSG